MAIGSALLFVGALPFVAVPSGVVWSWLLGSVALHTVYKLLLIKAYGVGDFGQVYPIARGSAPLMITVAMAMLFAEQLSLIATAGIATLVLGVLLMSVRGGRNANRMQLVAVGYALSTSVFIAAYMVVDGMGARASTELVGSATSYAFWLFFLDGLAMLCVLLASRGLGGLRQLQPYWRTALAGSAMSSAAYWIVIWAMTVAPIGLVAAIRETSVLFAALISIVFLREPFTRWRLISACLIVVGVALTRFT